MWTYCLHITLWLLHFIHHQNIFLASMPTFPDVSPQHCQWESDKLNLQSHAQTRLFVLLYFVSISNNDAFTSAPQAWFYLPEAQGQSHGDPEQGGWDRKVSAMQFISLTLCNKSPGRSGVYLLTGFFNFLFPFNISACLYPVIYWTELPVFYSNTVYVGVA